MLNTVKMRASLLLGHEEQTTTLLMAIKLPDRASKLDSLTLGSCVKISITLQ